MSPSEFARRALAHLGHTQRIEPFFQRQRLRRLARCDDLRRIFFAKNPRLLRRPEIQRRQRLQRHVVDIRRILHQLEFDQPRRHDFTQPIDGQRAPAAEKTQPPRSLRPTIVVLTLPRHTLRLIVRHLDSRNSAPANWTFPADRCAQIKLRRTGDPLVRE